MSPHKLFLSKSVVSCQSELLHKFIFFNVHCCILSLGNCLAVFICKAIICSLREDPVKVGSHDPFLDPIIFLSLYQLIEMLIRITNFFEFLSNNWLQKLDRVNRP